MRDCLSGRRLYIVVMKASIFLTSSPFNQIKLLVVLGLFLVILITEDKLLSSYSIATVQYVTVPVVHTTVRYGTGHMAATHL
jgi:hypothetical protein